MEPQNCGISHQSDTDSINWVRNMQDIHNKKKHHKKVLLNSYRFEGWLERILLLLFILECLKHVANERNNIKVALPSSVKIKQFWKYCLPTFIPVYSYTFAFTYRINLLNNAWQRFSSWSSEENPPTDQSTLWIKWLVWSKVAFLTSRTPSWGETEQKIITVKSMLHFKSGCSDKR